jgi:hypothetical protein
VNWKGIQVIIGLSIIAIMSISIFCNSESFTGFWNTYFLVDKKSRATRGDRAAGDEIDHDENVARVQFTQKVATQKSMNWTSLTLQTKKVLRKIADFLQDQKNLNYFILFWSTFLLMVVQVLFIHDYLEIESIQRMKQSTAVHKTCAFMEEYYMFEDLIYLPFSLVFLLILYVFLQSRRFNNYIMVKFKRYFKSKFFKVY